MARHSITVPDLACTVTIPDLDQSVTIDDLAQSVTFPGLARTITIPSFDYTLGIEYGSYVLSGQDVGLRFAYNMVAAQGSYALNGQDVTLTRTLFEALDQGSYSLSGQDAGLNFGFYAALDQGSYALTGQDIAFARALLTSLEQGAYALSGQEVALVRTLFEALEQGSYSLNGQDVTLRFGYGVQLDQGSYTLTGQDVGLFRAALLTADQGSYALNGQVAALTHAALLTANQGSYALTGQASALEIVEPAIEFVGAIAGNATNGSDVTLSLTGLSLQEDDIVILVGGHPRGDVAPSTPSGFTEISSPSGTDSTSIGAFYKFMTATPDTSVTGSGSGNSSDAEGYVALAFRGVSQSTPIDAAATYDEDAGGSTSPDSPSITTVTANAFVISAAGCRVDDDSITAPAGYAAVSDGVLFTNRTDSRDFTMAASYKVAPSAGAEDPAGWTNWTAGRWMAMTIALRPAA